MMMDVMQDVYTQIRWLHALREAFIDLDQDKDGYLQEEQLGGDLYRVFSEKLASTAQDIPEPLEVKSRLKLIDYIISKCDLDKLGRVNLRKIIKLALKHIS